MKTKLLPLIVCSLTAFGALPAQATGTDRGYRETGIGSEYGWHDGFQGARTASGTRFNTWAMTAASPPSRGLRFGTRVLVTNIKTHKSVVVTITDRGPFVHGRIIDISHAAALAIGMDGIAKVSVEVIQRGR